MALEAPPPFTFRALWRSASIHSAGKESACNVGDPGLIPGLGRSAGEGIGYLLQYSWASLVAQLVKNLPAMQETWVQSLGWEDPLQKGMSTHSSSLPWRIPWTEEPGRLQTMASQRVRYNWATNTSYTPTTALFLNQNATEIKEIIFSEYNHMKQWLKEALNAGVWSHWVSPTQPNILWDVSYKKLLNT